MPPSGEPPPEETLKEVEVEQSSMKARTQGCPFGDCEGLKLFPRQGPQLPKDRRPWWPAADQGLNPPLHVSESLGKVLSPVRAHDAQSIGNLLNTYSAYGTTRGRGKSTSSLKELTV